jgi:flagellar motor protein MotB
MIRRSALLLSLCWLFPSWVHAAGLFTTDIQNVVNSGEQASLSIEPDTDYRTMVLELARNDGSELKLEKSAIKKAERVQFRWPIEDGEWTYKGKLTATWSPDEVFVVPMEFRVVCAQPLQIEVPRATIDMEGLKLVAKVDRPAGRGTVELIGLQGTFETIEEEFDGAAAGSPLAFEWFDDAEVIKMVIKVWDVHGFMAFEDITPWSLEVPHEDVVFETNMAVIRPAEDHKLVRAAELIGETIDRYGHIVDIKIYIGGYTDTVGSNGDNMSLSQRRAKAIATWFAKVGFPVPIYFQGFGEEALAVSTDDNVDLEANRRAVYMLAAHPPIGKNFPRSDWQKVK